MTAGELRAALDLLGLPHQSRRTERLLGKSGRMIAHYLAGKHPIDSSVAVIVRLLVILCEAGATPIAIDTRLTHAAPRPRGRRRKELGGAKKL